MLMSLAAYVAACTAGALTLRSNDVHVSLPATVIGATCVACLGIVWGIRKQSPQRLRLPNALAGGMVAISWFVVVGSLVLAVSAIFAFGDITVARQALTAESVSQLGVLTVELAYLPNLIVWMAAYATGAGLAVGGDQQISMFASEAASLPDLPILAAVPTTAPAGAALLPLTIVVGGWLSAAVAQRQAPVVALRRRLARAAVLAGIVLVFWFVAAIISGGSLGDGRLDYVGPALSTPFAAATLVGVGAILWALIPTLASDARRFAGTARVQFDQHFRMPSETGTTRDHLGGSEESRTDAMSR
jgi:hypothetical protein